MRNKLLITICTLSITASLLACGSDRNVDDTLTSGTTASSTEAEYSKEIPTETPLPKATEVPTLMPTELATATPTYTSAEDVLTTDIDLEEAWLWIYDSAELYDADGN